MFSFNKLTASFAAVCLGSGMLFLAGCDDCDDCDRRVSEVSYVQEEGCPAMTSADYTTPSTTYTSEDVRYQAPVYTSDQGIRYRDSDRSFRSYGRDMRYRRSDRLDRSERFGRSDMNRYDTSRDFSSTGSTRYDNQPGSTAGAATDTGSGPIGGSDTTSSGVRFRSDSGSSTNSGSSINVGGANGASSVGGTGAGTNY
jgi:hypothetical protein